MWGARGNYIIGQHTPTDTPALSHPVHLFSEGISATIYSAQRMKETPNIGILASIHCFLVTQPPMGPMGPETS